MKTELRPVLNTDIEGIKEVIDSCELFPSEYLDEMIDDYLKNSETEEFWFTCIENKKAKGIGYCVPEKFTDGTFNLLSIGVKKEFQGKGIASEMMKYIENYLKGKSGRLLIVETSSDDARIAARKFYKKLGYNEEATIKDFWAMGEDKVIYTKSLM